MRASNAPMQSVKGMKEVFRTWPYYERILNGFKSEL